MVRSFQQQKGIDYNETFVSVVKPMLYKALFIIAAARDLEIEQMDVKTAFLYGDIDEDIYVYLPPGHEDHADGKSICKLLKALYGLKQAPRIWFQTLAGHLKELGFTQLTADTSIF